MSNLSHTNQSLIKMKNLKKMRLALIVGVVFCSCSKKIAIQPSIPLPMPQSLTGLLYLTPDHDGNNVNNLQDLPGRLIVFYQDSGKIKYDVTLEKFIDTTTGKIRALDKPTIQYQSILDKSASASLSFVLGSIDASADNTYQMIITDASGKVLDNNDKQRKIIETADIRKDAIKVLYITGASLFTFEYKSFAASQTSAALSGYAVNVAGKYYNSDTEYALDYKIAVDTYDVTNFNFKNAIATPEKTMVQSKVDLTNSVIVQSVHNDSVFVKKNDPSTNKPRLEKISDQALIKIINKYPLLDLQKAINSNIKPFTNILNKKTTR
jgi:hypothetical protein